MRNSKNNSPNYLITPVAMLALAALMSASSLRAQTSSEDAAASSLTYTNPRPVSIGDPDVLHIPGRYYIYGTGGGTFTSTNLVDWDSVGNTQPVRETNYWFNGAFWAPEVYQVKDKYYMFFSAQWTNNPTHEQENFRVGVAVSDSPAGPFKCMMNGPIFDPGYPAIDADVLFDTDGRVFLYYSRCCYKHSVESELLNWAKAKGWYTNIEESWVYGVELKPDFSGIIGEPVMLLRPPEKLSDPTTAWENLAVTSHTVNRRWTEGPSSFKHGNTYYIMYAANSVAAGGDYATGYATSDKPLGPFKKAANNPIIFRNTASGGNVTTTAHTCWTMSPDGTEMFVLYGGVIARPIGGGFGGPRGAGMNGGGTNTIPPPGFTSALGTNTPSGTNVAGGRGRGGRGGGFGGGGGRRLFVDRMEILPDGTLIAHSPTVTPQPYPSANKNSAK
jgi:GH43 family beta-xylosidase